MKNRSQEGEKSQEQAQNLNFQVPCLMGHGKCTCSIAPEIRRITWEQSGIGANLPRRAQEIFGAEGDSARTRTYMNSDLIPLVKIHAACTKEDHNKLD